jgi:hypothetical protein
MHRTGPVAAALEFSISRVLDEQDGRCEQFVQSPVQCAQFLQDRGGLLDDFLLPVSLVFTASSRALAAASEAVSLNRAAIRFKSDPRKRLPATRNFVRRD